jgi:hypothetical protein
MINKVLSYGAIGLLTIALVAGTGYILLSPDQAQAGSGSPGGQGRGAAAALDNERPQGTNQGAYGRSETTQSRGYSGNRALDIENTAGGRGRGYSTSQSRSAALVEWETLTGTVTITDDGIAVQTTEGEVIVGLGQAPYREDFALEAGDDVTITGFYEGGEFKVGTIENLTTGQAITLRDEAGRPMWAGRGRFQNQMTSDD